jgi:hypothetical protein
MFLPQFFQDAFKLRGPAIDFGLSGFYVALRGLEQSAQLLILGVEGMQRRLGLCIGRGGKAIDER